MSAAKINLMSINLNQLKAAIISATNNLINNCKRIDALNVFPVPDGDTGTNMSSTLEKAATNLQKNEHKKIHELMKNVSRDMLLGARGNSGVILSQIFKGFATAWSKIENEISTEELVVGFETAAKTAYASVLKPIEGTILTVIRETAEAIRKAFKKTLNVVDLLEIAYKASQKSLANTPNILAVLKEVGVVDSGGDGLVMILEGFLEALRGNPISINQETAQQLKFISDTEIYSGEFGYCTEIIVQLKKPQSFKKTSFVSTMEKLGNSLVVVQDQDILKVHIHTLTPGKILNFGQKSGEFLAIKIDNMTEQANTTKSQINDQVEAVVANGVAAAKAKNKRKKMAIISCNSGSGLINLMNEYECDYVIDGGQANNPSAQDFIDAIKEVNSDNVIVLPNNSNIILAAQQAAKIAKNKNVYIVPTKSQVEGVTAILNYSADLSVDDNLHEINSSLKNLVVGQVTQAIRSTKIDGIKVRKDDYLMIKTNKIIGSKKDVITAGIALINQMMKTKKKAEILVIYYGNNINALAAAEIEKYVLQNYDVDVEIIAGGQQIYDFLFGLE